jgi:hypothetical protein
MQVKKYLLSKALLILVKYKPAAGISMRPEEQLINHLLILALIITWVVQS